MPWYRSGTVACTQNSATVTGTGTAFAANARVGDAFLGPDGRWYEVANIASDTVLSILPAYIGPSVSAGIYALAPMQGYVKDSADALRALVNKFGALAASPLINALAGLTGAANKLPYLTAADTMALADFPLQARTLVAATTQAAQRTALGLGTAAVAPLVGPVSQSGGVATGAVVEIGTNANGTYTKFADGTMVCEITALSLPAIDTAQAAGSWNFPATFSVAPAINVSVRAGGSGTNLYMIPRVTGVATSGVGIAVIAGSGSIATTNTFFVSCVAKGRWF